MLPLDCFALSAKRMVTMIAFYNTSRNGLKRGPQKTKRLFHWTDWKYSWPAFTVATSIDVIISFDVDIYIYIYNWYSQCYRSPALHSALSELCQWTHSTLHQGTVSRRRPQKSKGYLNDASEGSHGLPSRSRPQWMSASRVMVRAGDFPNRNITCQKNWTATSDGLGWLTVGR